MKISLRALERLPNHVVADRIYDVGKGPRTKQVAAGDFEHIGSLVISI